MPQLHVDDNVGDRRAEGDHLFILFLFFLMSTCLRSPYRERPTFSFIPIFFFSDHMFAIAVPRVVDDLCLRGDYDTKWGTMRHEI